MMENASAWSVSYDSVGGSTDRTKDSALRPPLLPAEACV